MLVAAPQDQYSRGLPSFSQLTPNGVATATSARPKTPPTPTPAATSAADTATIAHRLRGDISGTNWRWLTPNAPGIRASGGKAISTNAQK